MNHKVVTCSFGSSLPRYITITNLLYYDYYYHQYTQMYCFILMFHSQNANTSAPLMLWLQGGPGGSSLFGLFNENGPLVVDSNGMVSLRNVTWNLDYHMLYIDNPVRTNLLMNIHNLLL